MKKKSHVDLSSQQRSDLFIKNLREKGVRVGNDCMFWTTESHHIDTTRPELVVIKNRVRVARGLTILTHGFDWSVLRELYPGELFGSAGGVSLGNNIFIGTQVTILKNVTVGDNCVIGAGSVVTKNIPENCVAVGNPCRVIMTIDELRKKYRQREVGEAMEYAKSIMAVGRDPKPTDFKEFFYLFASGDEAEGLGIDVRRQTTDRFYTDFFNIRKLKRFADFDSFIRYCKKS